MFSPRVISRIITIWLTVILCFASVRLSAAQDYPTIYSLQRLFPSVKNNDTARKGTGLPFRVEGYPCVALPDSGRIRYVFIFPTENGKKSEKAMQDTRPSVERLRRFLENQYGQASLHPFEDGESGYAIAINSLDSTSSQTSSNFPFGSSPYSFITFITKQGGKFHRCEGTDIVMKTRCARVPKDTCYISFSLIDNTVDAVGFVPGRSSRQSRDKLMESVAATLHTSTMTKPRNANSATNGIKYIATTSVYSGSSATLIATYRNRYYVGLSDEIESFIHSRRQGFPDSRFSYPSASDSIPYKQNEVGTAGARSDKQEEGKTTAPAPDRQDESKPTGSGSRMGKSLPANRPLSPSEALRDYIEYLRRLTRPK